MDKREMARERWRRHRAKKHAERFGPGAGDQRGRHGNHARASANGRWNDGRIEASHGYIKTRVGKTHPLADPNGYAYEHLIVWCSAGRPRPKRNELLHHKNDQKTDNRLRNLEIKTRRDHGLGHIKKRRRDRRTGRLLGDQRVMRAKAAP